MATAESRLKEVITSSPGNPVKCVDKYRVFDSRTDFPLNEAMLIAICMSC